MFLYSIENLLGQGPLRRLFEYPGFLVSLNILRPEIWVALSQMLCFRHHSRIMVAILLPGIDVIPAIAFRYATVVVLSDSTRMCFSLKAPQSDFRPNRTAFNSRKFFCIFVPQDSKIPLWSYLHTQLPSPHLRHQ